MLESVLSFPHGVPKMRVGSLAWGGRHLYPLGHSVCTILPFLFVFLTVSHAARASLKLAMQLRLALNWSSCLCFPSAEIIGMGHHTLLAPLLGT